MRRTKIVCTIGPASAASDDLDRLVKAGMDVARLNFSHGTHAEHAEVIRRIREGESRWGRPIAILQDLQGPKIRLGTFGPGGGARIDLEVGKPFTLSATPVEGTAEVSSVSHPEYLRELKVGDEIWMDDGMIQLKVEETSPAGVRCRVVAGGRISDHKGISFPHVPLPVSCLTPKDRDDLRFGIAHGVDFIAVSFVRSAADIAEVRKFLHEQGAELPIVAKLERQEVMNNLSGILTMVDAVMLAAESATGRYPVEAVEVMARIAERAEQATLRMEVPRKHGDGAVGFPEAISDAAATAARVLKARAIVAFTQSGFSARLISQERPDVPIIALTPFAEVQRRLGLSWGVSSRLIRKVETTDEMIEEIEATLLGDGFVRVNDTIVIISGAPMWVTGTTNLLKLHRVGERR